MRTSIGFFKTFFYSVSCFPQNLLLECLQHMTSVTCFVKAGNLKEQFVCLTSAISPRRPVQKWRLIFENLSTSYNCFLDFQLLAVQPHPFRSRLLHVQINICARGLLLDWQEQQRQQFSSLVKSAISSPHFKLFFCSGWLASQLHVSENSSKTYIILWK